MGITGHDRALDIGLDHGNEHRLDRDKGYCGQQCYCLVLIGHVPSCHSLSAATLVTSCYA